jgi:hypothetical protein
MVTVQEKQCFLIPLDQLFNHQLKLGGVNLLRNIVIKTVEFHAGV